MIRICFALILTACLTACPKTDVASKTSTPESAKKADSPNKAIDLANPKACDVYAPKCDNGTFCDAGLGACQTKGAKGICKPKPTVCNTILLPVCGCDGKTYSNECAAHKSGVSVLTKGECKN